MKKELTVTVCIKQVPMVSELPWDSRTRTLKRDLAPGMMDPASRRALEAALQLKQERPARINAIAMGPPMAEEVLYQALALGADQAFLLTDPKMAGADTFLTSRILARAIEKTCPETDLILCGSRTSDSETGQVGPQLAECLDLPSLCGANQLEITRGTLLVQRLVDGFSETLETALPALVTVDLEAFEPRYLSLSGVETAFSRSRVRTLNTADLDLSCDLNALKDSPTRILEVYSQVSLKEGRQLKGPVKQVVTTLFTDYGKTISSAMGRDIDLEEGDHS